MKFSYVTLLDYPLADSLEMIKTADELGYYACYAADETWHKDLWLVFAAAADKTQSIRFGPNVSGVYLREPTLICQSLGTLDELTGGRVDGVISCGNFGLLSQYGVDWKSIKAFSRVKEAHRVMRTFLDEGAITYDGEFFRYSGLFTFARPVQERLPLYIGAMRGPKSFQFAGEETDGVHVALSYTKEAYEYVVENVKIGAERAGRDWRSLDIGAWCVISCGPDSEKAKTAARSIVAFYISSMPEEQIRLHGLDPAEMQEIVAALGKGELDKAYELTTPEIAETLSIAGTPEECAARIKQFEEAGVNHMICCITDPFILKAFTGKDVDVPDANGQLRLIAEEVMPAFARAGAATA
jgi:alkanesulfonate monooxygenase SsuD/methylene tetrahydromethanopterin reductase-like flavin-dependent oxidoreductase (luciferase family)